MIRSREGGVCLGALINELMLNPSKNLNSITLYRIKFYFALEGKNLDLAENNTFPVNE